jgi:hypothetical protein
MLLSLEFGKWTLVRALEHYQRFCGSEDPRGLKPTFRAANYAERAQSASQI